ncbi:hypothetical protein VTJ49DRAFT_7288 [Mycothermus thermophilus]|uniref:Uncharacterized protein n=1 Tax=Humicola insolens TaxID=85995 RepID=A0ABR3VHD1_HUMIN
MCPQEVLVSNPNMDSGNHNENDRSPNANTRDVDLFALAAGDVVVETPGATAGPTERSDLAMLHAAQDVLKLLTELTPRVEKMIPYLKDADRNELTITAATGSVNSNSPSAQRAIKILENVRAMAEAVTDLRRMMKDTQILAECQVLDTTCTAYMNGAINDEQYDCHLEPAGILSRRQSRYNWW